MADIQHCEETTLQQAMKVEDSAGPRTQPGTSHRKRTKKSSGEQRRALSRWLSRAVLPAKTARMVLNELLRAEETAEFKVTKTGAGYKAELVLKLLDVATGSYQHYGAPYEAEGRSAALARDAAAECGLRELLTRRLSEGSLWWETALMSLVSLGLHKLFSEWRRRAPHLPLPAPGAARPRPRPRPRRVGV